MGAIFGGEGRGSKIESDLVPTWGEINQRLEHGIRDRPTGWREGLTVFIVVYGNISIQGSLRCVPYFAVNEKDFLIDLDADWVNMAPRVVR